MHPEWSHYVPEFKTIDEYLVVAAFSEEGLTEKVNDLMKQGWQPWKSGYSINGNQLRFCQPMVKGGW